MTASSSTIGETPEFSNPSLVSRLFPPQIQSGNVEMKLATAVPVPRFDLSEPPDRFQSVPAEFDVRSFFPPDGTRGPGNHS